MARNELKAGHPVPDCHHVARYCYPCTVKDQGGRKVVSHRAFERRGDKTADVSLSVMEYFEGESDSDVIYKVCQQRGHLQVRENGYYVKLNVGLIGSERYERDRRRFPIVFSPGQNPAHATLYTCGLMVSVELATLATQKGQFFRVPDPIPDVVFPD
jgi:hypothetical protein